MDMVAESLFLNELGFANLKHNLILYNVQYYSIGNNYHGENGIIFRRYKFT